MADRPIIMSAPMVCSLLAGTKIQTRRLISPEPRLAHFASEQLEDFELRGLAAVEQPDGQHLVYRPVWHVGDQAWVRENVRADELADGQDGVRYLANGAWLPIENSREGADRWVDLNHYGSTAGRPCRGRKVPSIHMPRWASRITLQVTEVRVQRLQDISEEDARAEGVEEVTAEVASSDLDLRFWRRYQDGSGAGYVDNAVGSFASLWTELHGLDAWQASPWVAAISFRVVLANIDTLAVQP